jgi:hypothetical protein
MGQQNMWVDDRKGREELGYPSTPVTEALTRAVHWYQDHGYVA